jgi:hypothetical protein
LTFLRFPKTQQTGAPTATVIDDGAPVCHVENSIEMRQAIIVRF